MGMSQDLLLFICRRIWELILILVGFLVWNIQLWSIRKLEVILIGTQ